MKVTCPYCKDAAVLKTGDKLYTGRNDLSHKKFWVCDPCGAYVGCHGTSDTPLGTIANQRTRMKRSLCHRMFDPLWKHTKYFKSRTKAYNFLSSAMGLDTRDCHFAMFDDEMCDRAIDILQKIHYNRYNTKLKKEK